MYVITNLSYFSTQVLYNHEYRIKKTTTTTGIERAQTVNYLLSRLIPMQIRHKIHMQF